MANRLLTNNNLWRWLGVLLALIAGVAVVGRAHARAVGVETDETSAPSLWLSPLEIHFGSVAVGKTTTRFVTIYNSGNAPLELSGGQVSPPFGVDMSACSPQVPAGGSCQIAYTFRTQSAGDYTSASSGASSAGPWGVALRARAVAPELQVNPRGLDFGRGPVGSDFASQTVTVTNIGGFPVGGFRADPVAPPFAGGLGTCTGTLQPGQSCVMTFDFAPEIAGVFRKEWTAASDAGPITIELQGRTYSGITGTGQGVTPRGIDFGPVLIGSTVRQTVVFRNHDPDIPIVNWTYEWIADEPAIDFDYRQNCGDVLAGLEECEVTISYRPRDGRRDEAILQVLNSQGIIDIELWGQGAAAEIVADAPVIDLGAASNGRSREQTVRFTNIGRAAATLLGLQSATAFAVTETDCGEALGPGAACTASVRFEPHGYGRFAGTVELLTDHAPVPVQAYGGIATPELGAAFAPATVRRGGLATLQLRIANSNPAQTLFDVGFDARVPAGMELADQPRASAECGDPIIVMDPGGTDFLVEEATVMAGKTCVVEVTVLAEVSGILRFSTTAHSHAGPSGTVSADLLVQNDETLTIFTYFPSVIGASDK